MTTTIRPSTPKSPCQLRLEARSLAYQQRRQQQLEKLEDAARARLQRAAEARHHRERQRTALARARVQHAQRVAAETHARRREELTQSRRAAHKRLEIAHQRRLAQLARLQETCKRRVEQVLEKVEGVREVQRYRVERQRRALEEHLIDAARRREEQTERMVRRLSERWQSVETVKDRVQRVKFIQRWYRRQVEARATAARLAGVRAQLGRLVASWRELSRVGVEPSMALLQARPLARAAQAVVQVLLPTVTPVTRRPPAVPFRVLLMVGMIAAHPEAIMENEPCPRLAFAARVVMAEMERLWRCVCGQEPDCGLKTAVARLEARFAGYCECFFAWKERDAERLAGEMLHGYEEIYATKVQYAAQTTTVYAGDGLHQLLDATTKQLVQLRQALGRVLGKEEARRRIEAVERRVTADANGEQEEDGGMEVENEDDSTADGAAGSRPTAHAGDNAYNDGVSHGPPAPPMQAAALLTDEKLVHELVLNPSFRLPDTTADDPDALETRIRGQMRKAFWDQVAETRDVGVLLQNLGELRTRFVTTLSGSPAAAGLVDEVSDALDPRALEALMMADPAAVGYVQIKERCRRVLCGILAVEAPVRNETTQTFIREFGQKFDDVITGKQLPVRVLVEFLAFALEKVEELGRDLANAHIEMLAAYLGRHGVAYERQKCAEKIANGATFPRTHTWLVGELRNMWMAMAPAERQALGTMDAKAWSEFLRTRMMSLVVEHIEGATGVWPETFDLDTERIRRLRDSMDRMALISAMLVIVQEYVSRRQLHVPREFFRSLAGALGTLLRSPGIGGAQLTTRLIHDLQQVRRANGLAVEDEELAAVETRLAATFLPGNAIFGLFASRVTAAVQVFAVNDRNRWSVHASLRPFEEELRQVALDVRRLFQHNEAVFGPLYREGVGRAMQELAQSPMGA